MKVLLSRIRLTALTGTILIGAASAQAQPVVIHDDYGGRADHRIAEIDELNLSGQPVEIRGNRCISACTMYLGLDNVCVAKNTMFGFHGPSEVGGAKLPRARFERWSKIVGSYYNDPLREWYMKEGRYKRKGTLKISGAELIRIGYQECAPRKAYATSRRRQR